MLLLFFFSQLGKRSKTRVNTFTEAPNRDTRHRKSPGTLPRLDSSSRSVTLLAPARRRWWRLPDDVILHICIHLPRFETGEPEPAPSSVPARWRARDSSNRLPPMRLIVVTIAPDMVYNLRIQTAIYQFFMGVILKQHLINNFHINNARKLFVYFIQSIKSNIIQYYSI